MMELRRIAATKSWKKNNVTLYESLKGSLLGKTYIRYFKHYPFIHGFTIYAWERLLPIGFLIYITFSRLNIFTESKYKRIPLKKTSDHLLTRQVILPKQSVLMPLPDIFPKNNNGTLNLKTEYEFPEIFISTFKNCTVTGASNFLNVDNSVVCHDLIRASHDYTSEELHGRFIINAKKSLVTLLSNVEVSAEIENGVVFTDAVSGNYVHFLTEVLPRVFLFSKECPNSNTSLVIDYGLHPNIMQALGMVIGNNINIIGLETDAHLLVKSLQVVSPCGYIPFQRRVNTKHLTDHSDGVFSPIALGMMSDFIKKSVSKLVSTSKLKKIFIKRNSKIRNLANAEDIEHILVADGFTVIEPESLSFIDQVNIFSNAEVVVGATGAAFGNLIFCNSTTKIIILTSDYKNMIYGYWQSMANAVGNKVTYVIGESVDVNSHLHSNFQINISDIKDAIAG